jgi:lysophospholipase L1-like esterase
MRRMNLTVAVVSMLLLSGCEGAPDVKQGSVPSFDAIPSSSAPACIEGVAVVGDSITSWNPPYALNPRQTWVTTAVENGMIVQGGWARPGARLDQMLANVSPSPDVCYLVVMGGTNDIVAGIPVEARLVALEAIIAAVGAERVVLSAVAPLGLAPEAGIEWNEVLAEHAFAKGYAFIDPWASFREGAGWVPGASLRDKVHPTPATAAAVGNRIAAQLDRFAIVDQAGPEILPLAF